jgi:hypothetical protein
MSERQSKSGRRKEHLRLTQQEGGDFIQETLWDAYGK